MHPKIRTLKTMPGKGIMALAAILLTVSGCVSPTQNTNQESQIEKPQMETPKLDSFEIVKFGPFRFVGKSVYASPFGGEHGAYGALWQNSDWIFKKLDEMDEHATEEKRHFGLITWEKYDDRTKLMGYTVGRFMKPSTPVPDGMDYFDVETTSVAKGFIKSKNADDIHLAHTDSLNLNKEAINQNNFNQTSWKWYAEAYPAGNPKKHMPDENGDFLFGTYISCEKK